MSQLTKKEKKTLHDRFVKLSTALKKGKTLSFKERNIVNIHTKRRVNASKIHKVFDVRTKRYVAWA